MTIVKAMFPEGDKLLENYYQMRKKMAATGLEYKKIDVCQNSSLLFYKHFEKLEHCTIHGHPRYKLSNSSGRRVSHFPVKILSYFPLIPRLQRLFMLKVVAENMT